jgi:nitric oxide dioxygenase
MNNEIAVTPEQIALVKETWSRVIPISEIASRLFYDRLFETSPHLAPMFYGVDLVSQRQKLVKAINMMVMSLERIDTLIPEIRELGKRHLNYGAEEAHYAEVGAALLWTLEAGLGDNWSREAETAWTNAYQLLASVMLEGAKEGMQNAA